MQMVAAGVLLVIVIIALIRAIIAKDRDSTIRFQIAHATTDPLVRQAIFEKKIRRGMSEDQVIASWGQPTAVTRQALKTKSKVTLRYGPNRSGSLVYIENDEVVGWRQSG